MDLSLAVATLLEGFGFLGRVSTGFSVVFQWLRQHYRQRLVASTGRVQRRYHRKEAGLAVGLDLPKPDFLLDYHFDGLHEALKLGIRGTDLAACGAGNTCWYYNAGGRFDDIHIRWQCLCGRLRPSRAHLLWNCDKTVHLRTGLRLPRDRCEERLLLHGVPEQPPAPAPLDPGGLYDDLVAEIRTQLELNPAVLFLATTAPSTLTLAPTRSWFTPAATRSPLATATRIRLPTSRSSWALAWRRRLFAQRQAKLGGQGVLSSCWTASRRCKSCFNVACVSTTCASSLNKSGDHCVTSQVLECSCSTSGCRRMAKNQSGVLLQDCVQTFSAISTTRSTRLLLTVDNDGAATVDVLSGGGFDVSLLSGSLGPLRPLQLLGSCSVLSFRLLRMAPATASLGTLLTLLVATLLLAAMMRLLTVEY